MFRFENYCLRYNISYGRFLEPFTLGDEEERTRAEKVRKGVQNALSPFLFKGETGTEDFVSRTEKFLASLETAWQAHVAKLTETSLYYAKCADQVDEKIRSLLDEMSETLVGKGDIAYFERMLKATVGTVKIALVPTWLDAVYVGGTDNRYLGGGDIYILGANVGKLPKGADGGTVISARDEEVLAGLDIPVSPTVIQSHGVLSPRRSFGRTQAVRGGLRAEGDTLRGWRASCGAKCVGHPFLAAWGRGARPRAFRAVRHSEGVHARGVEAPHFPPSRRAFGGGGEVCGRP